MSFWGYADYVSVAERRARAAREAAKLAKQGRALAPVQIEGRKIAKAFWGKAWCDNLERYADYANRLPRGRSYVCNGLVIDLRIEQGCVEALVSGSELYRVRIDIALAAAERWRAICTDCAGSIGSLVELLQGRLSRDVISRVCRAEDGLFPAPREIKRFCSCPDSAGLCKHIAAALYGVGARLDREPDLLFTLRGVDRTELVSSGAVAYVTDAAAGSGRLLESDDLSALFGLEIEAPMASGPKPDPKPKPTPASLPERKPSKPASRKPDPPKRRKGA